MWAAPQLQPQKFGPPRTIFSAAGPPQRRRSSVFVEKTGSSHTFSHAVISTTQKSDKPQHLIMAAKSETKTIPSGADVLKALEKAAAERAKRRKEKKRKTGTVSRKRENEGPPCNFDDVRPLSVKPEWGDRLEELEKRLQHLASG